MSIINIDNITQFTGCPRALSLGRFFCLGHFVDVNKIAGCLVEDNKTSVFCLGRQNVSAVIGYCAEICPPLFNDLGASGLDDLHNIAEDALGNAGIIVAEVALSGLGDPYLCSVSVGSALTDMDVDGFQRVVFVGPEEHPVGADLKNLRHSQSPLPGRTGGSGARWSG